MCPTSTNLFVDLFGVVTYAFVIDLSAAYSTVILKSATLAYFSDAAFVCCTLYVIALLFPNSPSYNTVSPLPLVVLGFDIKLSVSLVIINSPP